MKVRSLLPVIEQGPDIPRTKGNEMSQDTLTTIIQCILIAVILGTILGFSIL